MDGLGFCCLKIKHCGSLMSVRNKWRPLIIKVGLTQALTCFPSLRVKTQTKTFANPANITLKFKYGQLEVSLRTVLPGTY